MLDHQSLSIFVFACVAVLTAANGYLLKTWAGNMSTANAALSTQSTVVGNSTLTGTVTESGTNAPLSGVLVIASRASDYSVAVAGTTNGSGQYSLTVTQGQGYKLQFVDPTGLHDMEWHDNQPYFGIANATTVNAPATTNAALDRLGALLFAAALGLMAWRTTVGGLSAWQNQSATMMLGLPE